MEKISISLKPILWRLLLWRSYPGLLLTGIATLISLVTPTPSFLHVFSTHMIPWLLGIFTAEILFSLFEWFNKKLNIEIQDDKITGSKY